MNWLHGLNGESITARPAAPADRPAVVRLLAGTWRRHGPLALEAQIALLGNGLSTLAFAGKEAVGFLGVSLRQPAGNLPERWADLVLLGLATGHSPRRLLAALLAEAGPRLWAAGATGLVCLTEEAWLLNGLGEVGFDLADQVVGYAHTFRAASSVGTAERTLPATLRPVAQADADRVLALNAACFAPIWIYDDAKVLTWLLTADRAVLAELGGQPVGFALTSDGANGDYAQLIRVAVSPAAQGRGIGRLLVADAISHAAESGAPGLGLNTQASNSPARRLYESLKFQPTAMALRVMVWEGGD